HASPMLMDLPTTHQLTTLTLQPTRASACPFTLYSGFIAGHICVPAGGGEGAVGVLSHLPPIPHRCTYRYICFRAQHRHVSDPISRRAGSDRPAARSNRIDHSRLQIVAFIVSATFACKLVNAARARWEELRLSTHDPELVAAAIRTRREGILWVWEAPAAELIDAHQRQHLAQREPAVSGPLGAAQQE